MSFHTRSIYMLPIARGWVPLSVWSMPQGLHAVSADNVCSGGRLATSCAVVIGTWMASFDSS